jgi:hypothetical protein
MTTTRVEPTGVPGWGIDLPTRNRPGIPYERPPQPVPGAHWTTPARQVATVEVLKRAGLAELTPVFGTAVPPHGLSGSLRRLAYQIPDHDTRHWLVLMAADRVDVIESDVGGFVRRSLPILALVVAVGAGIGALRRPRRRRWI